ncbi:alpha/beta-hydrolase [Gonapodya prolifera JEL478]|uniref:Alpha/beta-hydrolase n=1 Tax=Gonapodya prolifera (strain JEL478) TaxID=1344416 RepID=A0A139ADV5_GONPJ|nr:alpha/beta-hydrolase [Gonapodya prolifera JEL478]|eukprot:KXS14774.1 alpha/beta-hydrolase [Gonapodya prolifera JEL478]
MSLTPFSSAASLRPLSVFDRLFARLAKFDAVRALLALNIVAAWLLRNFLLKRWTSLWWTIIGQGAPKLALGDERKRIAKFKLLEDESVGKHRYITLKSGIKLHAVEAGALNAPLLILLHGYPQNWYIWHKIIPPLARHLRVVAPDMRGYGGSDKPELVQDYHADHLTTDVKELAEALQVEAGKSKNENFILGGHDWGAVVCWDFASRYPTLLSRLIIINVPPPWTLLENMTFRQLRKSWYIVWFQFPGLADAALSANDAAGLVEHFLRHTKGVPESELDVYRVGMAEEGRATAAINFYRANITPTTQSTRSGPPPSFPPTLILWGDQDYFLDTETCLWGIERGIPELQVEILKGVGHFVPDEEPERVVEVVERFLVPGEGVGSGVAA